MRKLTTFCFLATITTAALAADHFDLSKVDLDKLPAPAKKTGLTYETDVKPLFEASCVRCHGAERQRGGLRLDNLEGAIKGAKEGKVILPKNSRQSVLVVAVAQIDDELAMPPKRGGRPRGGGPGGSPDAAKKAPSDAGGSQPQGAPGGQGGGKGGPPAKPLSAEQVGLIRAWIDQGAK